jgi:hypothetical protein
MEKAGTVKVFADLSPELAAGGRVFRASANQLARRPLKRGAAATICVEKS